MSVGNNNEVPFLLGGLCMEVRDRFKDAFHTDGVRNKSVPIEPYAVVVMEPSHASEEERKFCVVLDMKISSDSSSGGIIVAPIKVMNSSSYASELRDSDVFVSDKAVCEGIGASRPVSVRISEQEVFSFSVDQAMNGNHLRSILTGEDDYPMVCGRFILPESLHEDILEAHENFLTDRALFESQRPRMSDDIRAFHLKSPLSQIIDYGAPE